MVREPGDAPDQGFDLDAFRELLLGHDAALLEIVPVQVVLFALADIEGE